MSLIRTYVRKTQGRRFAVGDIHGNFTLLEMKLKSVGFDPETDELFSVGDMVNRGVESALFTRWLQLPWFHAVMGNHEEMCKLFLEGRVSAKDLRHRGGSWLTDVVDRRDHEMALEYLSKLPVAMEVETSQGWVGIVHAGINGTSWHAFKEALQTETESFLGQPARTSALWDGSRFHTKNCSIIEDLRALVVGHTKTEYPVKLGNVYHIDTARHGRGQFSLIELDTLNIF